MITSYDYRSCYENDLVSLVGGGQRWYGELFDIDLEQTFNFSVPNITMNLPISMHQLLRMHRAQRERFRDTL